MYPWLDYSGRLSCLKLLVLISLIVPGAWIALGYDLGHLGAQPILEAERQFGLWTIRLLFISLVISPLRQILQWPRLILVRRMIGVAVFAYAATHFMLYVVDQAFDLPKVASEIVLRLYLTIGFMGLLGATALAATSSDIAIRRLGGGRWQRLHQLIYVVAVLAVSHYFMQSKLDEWEPTIMAGLLTWLLGYRIMSRAFVLRASLPFWSVSLLGISAAIATALGEAAYFWVSKDVSPALVLPANFSLTAGPRPAFVVLVFGLILSAAAELKLLSARALLLVGRRWTSVTSRNSPPRA